MGDMLRLALLLLASIVSRASAQACSCYGAPSPASSKCSSAGDPHYRTFGGAKYDFMARGVYQLVRARTSCGCFVEVQVFMASSKQHVVSRLWAQGRTARVPARASSVPSVPHRVRALRAPPCVHLH